MFEFKTDPKDFTDFDETASKDGAAMTFNSVIKPKGPAEREYHEDKRMRGYDKEFNHNTQS